MRWLPKSLVIHEWLIEVSKLQLTAISVSADGRSMQVARQETVDAYNKMSKDALKEGVRLKIIWAFRSSTLQRQQFEEAKIKHGKRGAIRWLAPPGFSEHQTGWAIDIGDESDPDADDNPLFERTPAFKWLSRNAARYGFELSFPKNNWQGVGYEPWHWRFVGNLEARNTFHPRTWGKIGIWSWSIYVALKHWIFG
jgi:D-alanyl-D-alanine carboxypeptidase